MASPTQGAAVGLTDDGDDGHVVELGVVEAVGQMDGSGSRRSHARAGAATELGVAHRLQGAHLFVTGLDETRLIVGPSERTQ